MYILVHRQRQVCPFTHHEGILGDGDTVTLVLNLRTRRRSVVSLRTLSLYTREMASQSRSERFGLEEINPFPLPGFEPRIIQPVAWWLHWLRYLIYIYNFLILFLSDATSVTLNRGTWPARSPNLTPCDYFLWGYVKDKVFVPPQPVSLPDLKNRITVAVETITPDMLSRVWQELDYRLDVCRVTKGAYIEHL